MQRTFKFNKLIRDLLYDDMIQNDTVVKLKDVSKEGLILYFKEKILEEAQELQTYI
ncbi:MAG: hypothetical protein K940chlam8_00949 [Chlamydiae bacterium]|nr:hypothetical protein [Chlamydiota bacterium]